MPIRIAVAWAYAVGQFVLTAPARAAAQGIVPPVGSSPEAVRELPSLRLSPGHRSTPFAQATLRRSLPVDSTARSHLRAAVVGGAIGGVVGGLSAAGYILNATAYHCVTVGPPCPYDPHTGQRVVVISAGIVTGAVLGAWVGQRFAR